MYLSRLWLDLTQPPVFAAVNSSYRLHQLIQDAFDARRTEAGVLYRLEPEPREGLALLLVQSLTAPRWPRAAPLTTARPPEVKEFTLAVPAGARLRFRLRGNPTKRAKATGKRVDLRTLPEQLAWLDHRAADAGFQLPDRQRWRLGDEPDERDLPAVTVSDRGLLTGRKAAATISCRAVDFDGHLLVTDPARLLAAVCAGIGPAKAFGCGLLSLAPA